MTNFDKIPESIAAVCDSQVQRPLALTGSVAEPELCWSQRERQDWQTAPRVNLLRTAFYHSTNRKIM